MTKAYHLIYVDRLTRGEIMKEISDLAMKQLKKYLRAHESDIAYEVNDFKELRLIFVEIVGIAPSEEP